MTWAEADMLSEMAKQMISPPSFRHSEKRSMAVVSENTAVFGV